MHLLHHNLLFSTSLIFYPFPVAYSFLSLCLSTRCSFLILKEKLIYYSHIKLMGNANDFIEHIIGLTTMFHLQVLCTCTAHPLGKQKNRTSFVVYSILLEKKGIKQIIFLSVFTPPSSTSQCFDSHIMSCSHLVLPGDGRTVELQQSSFHL